MIVSEIKLYEMLKSKIGEKEAEAFVEILEKRVEKKFEEKQSEFILEKDKDKLLTKLDAIAIFATKADFALPGVKLVRAIYIVGLVQYLAIMTSLVVIVKLFFHQIG